VIGKDGHLPWKIGSEWADFKKTTLAGPSSTAQKL